MNGETSFRNVLSVIFKRKWTILSMFLAFEIALVLGNSLVPVSYEATAKLLIQRARSELVLTPTDVRPGTVLVGQPQDLNSEADIIKSRILLEHAARRVGPERLQNGAPAENGFAFRDVLRVFSLSTVNAYLRLLQPPNSNGHGLSPLDRSVLDLAEAVQVVPLQASNVIRVGYRHASPTVAADTVNEVVKAYLDFSLNLKQRSGAYDLFSEQTRQAETRLRELEEALLTLEQTAGILSPQTQREVGLVRLADLESTARLVRAEVAQARARVEALQLELHTIPTRVETVQELRRNQTVDDLKKRLAELEVERAKLVARYTERHRNVKENENQIATLQAWLRRETEHVVGASRTDINPTSQALAREVAEVQAALGGLRAKEQVLTTELDGLRRQLSQLHSRAVARDRLVREVKAVEDAYFLYKRKTEEARIDSVLDQSRISNVKVAEWARPPLEPSGMRRGLLMAFGSTVGLAGAFGIAFGRESLDRRITSRRDVERHLGLPVLVSIPRLKDV